MELQTEHVPVAELKKGDDRSPKHSEGAASVHNESPREVVVQTHEEPHHDEASPAKTPVKQEAEHHEEDHKVASP